MGEEVFRRREVFREESQEYVKSPEEEKFPKVKPKKMIPKEKFRRKKRKKSSEEGSPEGES